MRSHHRARSRGKSSGRGSDDWMSGHLNFGERGYRGSDAGLEGAEEIITIKKVSYPEKVRGDIEAELGRLAQQKREVEEYLEGFEEDNSLRPQDKAKLNVVITKTRALIRTIDDLAGDPMNQHLPFLERYTKTFRRTRALLESPKNPAAWREYKSLISAETKSTGDFPEHHAKRARWNVVKGLMLALLGAVMIAFAPASIPTCLVGSGLIGTGVTFFQKSRILPNGEMRSLSDYVEKQEIKDLLERQFNKNPSL